MTVAGYVDTCVTDDKPISSCVSRYVLRDLNLQIDTGPSSSTERDTYKKSTLLTVSLIDLIVSCCFGAGPE